MQLAIGSPTPIPKPFDAPSVRRLTERLRALTPADWDAIRERLAHLRGDGVGAVWRRARHRSLWFAPFLPGSPLGARVLFAAGELASEFRPPRDFDVDTARARGRMEALPPGPDRERRQALLDLREAIAGPLRDDRVLVEAVSLAGFVLGYRDAMSPDDLARGYQPLDGVIPFAELLT